ncbi:hypothetical protein AHAS_Ahas19G0221900 [Arachis hypogaea]
MVALGVVNAIYNWCPSKTTPWPQECSWSCETRCYQCQEQLAPFQVMSSTLLSSLEHGLGRYQCQTLLALPRDDAYDKGHVYAKASRTCEGIRLGSANPKECFRSGGSNANNQWHGFFKLLKKGPQMPFQPFHPLKKDVSKLSRRKSKRVREDLILSSFDSEFANFKSSWKNFTLSELQAATDDFNHGRDKRPVKSLVVGRPILLALEDIDEGTKVEEILRQSTDVEEVDRRVQEYEQAYCSLPDCKIHGLHIFISINHLEDMKQQGGLEKWLKLLQVVESPIDSALILDGALLSAYQYFENMTNREHLNSSS